jgi:hypothetical protein
MLGRPQHAVKRFDLPDRARVSEPAIDEMCRCALDRLCDLRERHNFKLLVVNQRRENQMHMVRHNHRDMKIDLYVVFVQAAFERERTCPFGEDPRW